MKFEKFVKSLATKGVIYETDQFLEKRWLSSLSVLMPIPDTIRSITASDIKEAPETIRDIINEAGYTVDAVLAKVIMPVADSKIKDCVRIYQSEDGEVSIPISNDDYGLIDRADITEILYHYTENFENPVPKALLIKKPGKTPADENELIGVIFPVITE